MFNKAALNDHKASVVSHSEESPSVSSDRSNENMLYGFGFFLSLRAQKALFSELSSKAGSPFYFRMGEVWGLDRGSYIEKGVQGNLLSG
jgi:hypothetical protein